MELLVTVEGNSFTGKTTLATALTNRAGHLIKEYYFWVSSFPPFPHADQRAAEQNVDHFLEAERRRSRYAREIGGQNGGNWVVMDRSGWSILAFQYAIGELGISPSAYNYAREAFQKALENREILIPNAIVLMSPDEKEFNRRVDLRGRVGIDFLNDPKTSEIMDRWYRQVVLPQYGENALILGNGDLQEQTDTVDLFLQGCRQIPNSQLRFS